MRLSTRQLLRRVRASLGCGLAILAMAAATTAPANAQRSTHGDVWRSTGSRTTTSSHVRIGRGYDSGHYETRSRKVWVAGSTHRTWIPAAFEWHYDSCGRRHQVLVRAGHYDTHRSRGRYEIRRERVWVPARRIHIDRIHNDRYQRRDHNRGQQRNRVTHVGRRHRS